MNRAIRLMQALQFVMCHLAPYILPGALMFQAQLASTTGSLDAQDRAQCH